MEDLTPIQRIDKVLTYLKNKPHRIDFDSLQKEMKDQGVVKNDPELRTLIDKLQFDRNIIYAGDQDHPDLWQIAYEGLLFESYEKKREIDDLNHAVATTTERIRLRNETWVAHGTWFAGIAAFALILWQVFLYLYPIHRDYPLFFWQK